MDGTKPNSLSIAGLSMSDNVDNIVKQYEQQGLDLIAAYVSRVNGFSAEEMDGSSRCDEDMPDFALDPGSITHYGGD
jgi:hypothetical protein